MQIVIKQAKTKKTENFIVGRDILIQHSDFQKIVSREYVFTLKPIAECVGDRVKLDNSIDDVDRYSWKIICLLQPGCPCRQCKKNPEWFGLPNIPYLGVGDVANALEISVQRVRQLLPMIEESFKNSSGWQISRNHFAKLSNRPKHGSEKTATALKKINWEIHKKALSQKSQQYDDITFDYSNCEYLNMIENLLPINFSSNEHVSERNIVKSTNTVYINGSLPLDESFSGLCLILFKRRNNNLFTLPNIQPSNILFSGVGTDYSSEKRRYVISTNNNEKYYILLGNVQLLILSHELKDLCQLIDFYYEHYIRKISKLKVMYGLNNFEISAKNSGIYRLFKITIGLWSDLLDFAHKYDLNSDQTEWNLFKKENYAIKILSRSNDKRFNTIFHSYILAELVDLTEFLDSDLLSHFKSTDEIWVCWKLLKRDNSPFNFKNTWTAEDTYHFLIEKMIPKVVFDIDNQYRTSKQQFSAFLSEFEINDYIRQS